MWIVDFQMFKLDLEKAEEPWSNCKHPLDHWKSQSSRKTSTSALLTMPKLWLCGSQQTVENSWQDGNTRPPDLPLEKSVCRSKSNTVRTGHGTTDWFQIRKGVCQSCKLLPCLLNFYAEYIMQNARLDEAQAGIKIARRNINSLRYVDDTTQMSESEEEV